MLPSLIQAVLKMNANLDVGIAERLYLSCSCFCFFFFFSLIDSQSSVSHIEDGDLCVVDFLLVVFMLWVCW